MGENMRRARGRVGARNNNWRGGRSKATNGYILVRVGVGHPMADVRGYVYEHRLVASNKMGRILLRSELVHHINGDKTDNRPENLEVLKSVTHHLARHRKVQRGLRGPDEPNVPVICACGCGTSFPKFDKYRRPRRYVSGHNDTGQPKDPEGLR